jgi:ATP-dependent Clp protease ATP-binding subunit ClpA
MAIRWDKLTLKSQEALQKAGELANENGNPELVPIHLLGALLGDQEGIVAPVLRRIGVAPERLLVEANAEIGKLPKVSGGAAQPNMSPVLQKALDSARSLRTIRRSACSKVPEQLTTRFSRPSPKCGAHRRSQTRIQKLSIRRSSVTQKI